MTKNYTNKPKKNITFYPPKTPTVLKTNPIVQKPAIPTHDKPVNDSEFNNAYSEYAKTGVFNYKKSDNCIMFVDSDEADNYIEFNSHSENTYLFLVNEKCNYLNENFTEPDKKLLFILIVGVITSTNTFYQANLETLLKYVIELRF